jgi:hypothetical protein
MNTLKKIFVLALIVSVLLLALPQQALAASPGLVVLGPTYTLESGDVLDDNLFILGGTASLEVDSVVKGNVILLGGNLSVAGVIEGNLTAAGGVIYIQDTATVEGDFSSLGAQIEREQGAEIWGDINSERDIPFNIVPGNWQNTFMMPATMTPILDLGWFSLRVVLWGLLGLLVVMFLPVPTERVARAITGQPLVAGGLGLATGIILPILLMVLVLTICLIPFTVIGFLLLALAWVFGFIAVGLELGKRFGRIFNREWQPALAAGLGTFLLALLLNGMGAVIPCLGWIPQLIVGALGLGGVLLTRFGTQEYINEKAVLEPIEPPPAA